MRKLVNAFIIVSALLLTLAPVKAGDFYVSLSGSFSVTSDSLTMVDFSIRGDAVNNVRGYINYPADRLSVFSIEKNDSLSEVNVTFDTKTSGSIYFAAQSSSNITADTSLFTVTFVVHEKTGDISITTSDVYADVLITEKTVINQKQIDEAKEKEKACQAMGGCIDEIVIPDPIYEDRTVNTDQSFVNDTLAMQVHQKPLHSLYLKKADFPDAKCTPVFNKLTSAYKVEVDSRTRLSYDFVPENPDVEMEVSDEINNQIIVTLTGKNGDVNSYVFTIIRTINFDPASHNRGNITHDTNVLALNTSTYLLMAALGLVSLGFIIIGSYYIYIGAREP